MQLSTAKKSEYKIQKLAIRARNSISKYCFSECKSFCCRNGFLLLSEKEAKLVAGEAINKLMDEKILTLTKDKQYLLNLGVNEKECPQLQAFKCEIHGHLDRPKACRDFPIFIWNGNKIKFSGKCPAYSDGILKSYLEKFIKLGCEII